MNATLTLNKPTSVRKIGGENVSDLPLNKAIALALVNSVSTSATARQAEGQSWGLAATQAADICAAIVPDPDKAEHWQEVRIGDRMERVASRLIWEQRETALAKERDNVIKLLRDEVLTKSVAELGMARDVRAMGELDQPQSLMARAEKRAFNYYDARLIRGFRAGVAPQLVDVKGAGKVPESSGTFLKRVTAAELANRGATGSSDLKAALGAFRGNLNAIVKDSTTMESSTAIRTFLNGAEELVKLTMAGIIGTEAIANLGEQLHTKAVEAADEWKAANKDSVEESTVKLAAMLTAPSLEDDEDSSDESIHGKARELPERETA